MKEQLKELEKKQDNSYLKISQSKNLGAKRYHKSINFNVGELLKDITEKKQKVQHNE